MQTLEQISFFHMTYLFFVEFEKKEVFNRVIEKFIIGRLLNLKVLKKRETYFLSFLLSLKSMTFLSTRINRY